MFAIPTGLRGSNLKTNGCRGLIAPCICQPNTLIMMDFQDFKDAVDYQIGNATDTLYDERNVLDLRVGRFPYKVNVDIDVFSITEINDVYDFIKDAEEWYVDVYENFVGENYAEFTGFAVASWE